MKIRQLLFLLIFVLSAARAEALNIVLNFKAPGQPITGFTSESDGGLAQGPATNVAGGGTLQQIVTQAAAYWSAVIKDNATVTIDYGWYPRSGNVLATHRLVSQSGGRETAGSIGFDNDSFAWFLDSTPQNNSEYPNFTLSSQNLGGSQGPMNTGRVYSGATGAAVGRIDLLSVAMHELGHSLGLASSNNAYSSEAFFDNKVDIQSPLPFSGADIPVDSAHITLPDALMTPSVSTDIRRFMSVADILANAEISNFQNLDLNLSALPEPSTYMLATGSLFLLGLLRRKANQKIN